MNEIVMPEERLNRLARACVRDLALEDIELPDEFNYSCLPLCVIDAVYSIGIRYEHVQRVVARYCDHFGIVRCGRSSPPPLSLADLVAQYETMGVEAFAERIFEHRGRTSPINGILKAEAVLRFAQALTDHGVRGFEDLPGAMHYADLKRAIRSIPGQRSGISLQYFWMLAGSDEHIKPDRMVLRYVARAVGAVKVQDVEAEALLKQAAHRLADDHPGLTPRRLDYAVWQFESGRG